jgi:oligopeptide transport system substrate-binding protein
MLSTSSLIGRSCRFQKPAAIVSNLVMAALLAVGVTSAHAQERVADLPAANGPGSFTFINRGDVITLDLNQMSYLQDFRVTYALREGLYTYRTSDMEPTLQLATEAKLSEDKKTWTFTLRDNAKWSNGDPVTADDFVFSWRNLLESPGEYTSLFYYITGAEAYQKAYAENGPKADFTTVGIKAINPTTLEVKLDYPVPFLPDLFAFPTFYPRNQKSMEPFKSVDDKGRVSYDSKYTRADNVVLNGAYLLSEWSPGKQLVMTANPNYWDKANVKSEKVIMVVNNDPQSAFQQYESGKVDWLADVAPDISFKLKQINRNDLRTTAAYGTAFLTFNCAPEVPGQLGAGKKNPLSDVRVRQALAMATDKQYIVDVITRMGEKTASSYIPPGFFKDFVSTPTPGFDPDAARKLLAEAGYPDGEGFPTLSLAYNSDNPTRKAFGEFLVQIWNEELGINVDLKPLELKMYRSQVTEKNYTIAAVAWYGDYMDLSTWTDKYLSTSENNDSNWGPAAYDALLAQAQAEPDEKKRADILQKAEAMINTELPILPLYHYVNVSLHRDNVQGIVPNAKLIVMPKYIKVVAPR